MELDQNIVQSTKDRIKHGSPDQRLDDRGNNPGQEDQRADQRLIAFEVVDEKRRDNPKSGLKTSASRVNLTVKPAEYQNSGSVRRSA